MKIFRFLYRTTSCTTTFMVKTSLESKERFTYIDALRGLAILGVLVFHTTSYGVSPTDKWFQILVAQGARGVQLFYVLSAMTLCLSLFRRGHEKHRLLNFFIRRIFRVVPLFYIAILYYLWQSGYWSGNPAGYSVWQIGSVTFFSNAGSPYWINSIVPGGWSMAIEMGFYTMLPFLHNRLKTLKATIRFLAVSVIAAQILRLILLSIPLIPDIPLWREFTFLFFPTQWPVFLFGMLAYFLLFREKEVTNDLRELKMFTIGFGVIAILQFLSPVKFIAGHYIYSFFFVGIILMLAQKPWRLVVNPVTKFFGDISYSLYLSHFAVMYWLDRFGLVNLVPTHVYLNYAARLVLVLICASIVSTLLYRLVELPGQELGKKLIERIEHKKELDTTKEAEAAAEAQSGI